MNPCIITIGDTSMPNRPFWLSARCCQVRCYFLTDLLAILAANKPTFLSLRKCLCKKSGKIHLIHLHDNVVYHTWGGVPVTMVLAIILVGSQ